MKNYWFKMLKSDGSAYEFQKKFPSAYRADGWSSKMFLRWMERKINYLIIFEAGKEA